MTKPEYHSEPFTGDYRSFVDLVQRRVRKQWRAVTAPNADAQPALWMHRDEYLHVVPVPGGWLENAATKEALVERVIVPLIKAGELIKLAMSMAAWMVDLSSPAGTEIARLRDAGQPTPPFNEIGLPGVREHVIVSVFDAERHEFWHASVVRSDTMGPILGRFRMPMGPDQVEGLLADPIKAAMR
jgi:hypothetical protein